MPAWEELVAEGILNEDDVSTAESVRTEVQQLNASGDGMSKKAFVEKFTADHPDSKVRFQIIRGNVLVPVVDAPKARDDKAIHGVWSWGRRKENDVHHGTR